MLISVKHLSKKYAVKQILSDVSFAVEEWDKIALVGINGSGKTTLLKIIAEAEQYDSGEIIKKRELRIAMLQQTPLLNEQDTVLEAVLAGVSKAKEYEAKTILTRLGMRDLSQRCGELSGGQKKRVALAQTLLQPCDLLILDEPTNHLDTQMIRWLEHYLKRYSAALLMVTHDRYFLENVCTRMFELSAGELFVYEANYSTYIEEKEKRLALRRTQEAKRRQILKKELEWVRAGVQARSTKSRSRLERFERLSEQTYTEVNEEITMSFANSRLGKKTIECEQIAKRYGGRTLFSHWSYTFQRHDRIGIIGENGCGKTTLLKALAQKIDLDEGTITYGETVKIAYFHQGHEEMDAEQRVIDYIQKQRDAIDTKEGVMDAAQMLERFLFDRSMHYTPIKFLSGGEKRRLYLLRVLMEAPNVLLLDEPTNDLDITTLAILEDYLDSFPGIIVTVSHDRYFLDRVCDSLWVFTPDGIRRYIGGYSANQEWLFEDAGKETKPKKDNIRTSAVPKMTSKEKQELAAMEETIAGIEANIAQVDASMAQTQEYQALAKLGEQREHLQGELEKKMERWMELSERKEAIDALVKR